MTNNNANAIARHYRKHSINALQVAQEWEVGPALFSVLKYIQRAGLKQSEPRQKDMLKAVWYMVYETAFAQRNHEDAQTLADEVVDLILRACPSCLYPISTDAMQDSSGSQSAMSFPCCEVHCSPDESSPDDKTESVPAPGN